jgi:hypothetical protein
MVEDDGYIREMLVDVLLGARFGTVVPVSADAAAQFA